MTQLPEPASTRLQTTVKLPRLYAIIDSTQLGERTAIEVAEELLAAGVQLIQLRDKHAASGELFSSSQQIALVVRKSGGIFILNDRVDVARAVDADGVHVGQED